MRAFRDYHEARAHAQTSANDSGHDVSLRKQREYGREVYIVSYLPAPASRFGVDLQGEVVRPECQSARDDQTQAFNEALREA